MSDNRERGWGQQARSDRLRSQMQQSLMIEKEKEDLNDPFVYKRPKQFPPKKPLNPAANTVPHFEPMNHHHHSGDGSMLPPHIDVNSDISSLEDMGYSDPPISIMAETETESGMDTKESKKKDKKKEKEKKSSKSTDKVSGASHASSHASSHSMDASPELISPHSTSFDGPSPTSGDSSSGARLIHACLVDLFQMIGLDETKGFGPKGLALVKSIDHMYTLLIYAPQTTKHEFTVPLSTNFRFDILPDRFATFTDPMTKRDWSVKFNTVENAHSFARALAMCKDDLSAFEFVRGGARRVIVQDLALGSQDGPSVAPGDTVKMKLVVHLTSPTHPIGIGERVYAKDSKKFVVGEGKMSIGIEQSVVGMTKKGVRFVVVPPMMSDEIAEWGPHVPPNSTLLIEMSVVSITSINPSEMVALPDLETHAAHRSHQQQSARHSTDHSNAQNAHHHHHQSPAPAVAMNPHPVETIHHHPTAAAAVAQPAPVPAVSTPAQPTTVAQSTPQQRENYDLGLQSVLAELSMLEFLPNFKTEGVRYADLCELDNDDLKVLVPAMGPRRRLQARLTEMQAARAAAMSRADKGNTFHHAVPAPIPAHIPTTVAQQRNSSAFSLDEVELKHEYERGKNEALNLTREKVASLKESAASRLSAIQAELDEQKKKNEDDIQKARDFIARLKEELRNVSSERDSLHANLESVTKERDEVMEKSRTYIAQMKSNHATKSAEAVSEKLKSSLDGIYRMLSEHIEAKEFYEGHTILEMTKRCMKTVISQQLQQ